MSNDPNAFLLSGGVPSAKFPTIGTLVRGTILDSEVTQQTDIDGNAKTYKDGNPMMQLVITLQTDERDADIENDNGVRKLYVKNQMRTAVADAVRGHGGFKVGGTLAVKFDHEIPHEKKGYNAHKVYVAQYAPPSETASNDLLGVGASAPAEEAAAPAAGGVPADSLLD